ncbi:MAG: hypothetical protein ACKVQA_03930 [Burkholderiales bacterium]
MIKKALGEDPAEAHSLLEKHLAERQRSQTEHLRFEGGRQGSDGMLVGLDALKEDVVRANTKLHVLKSKWSRCDAEAPRVRRSEEGDREESKERTVELENAEREKAKREKADSDAALYTFWSKIKAKHPEWAAVLRARPTELALVQCAMLGDEA